MRVYKFRTTILRPSASATLTFKASRASIERYITLAELAAVFGGYVRWREPARQSAEMDGEAIGVWGHRNVSRLCRILRERGATLEVTDGEGPMQRLAEVMRQAEPRTRRRPLAKE